MNELEEETKQLLKGTYKFPLWGFDKQPLEHYEYQVKNVVKGFIGHQVPLAINNGGGMVEQYYQDISVITPTTKVRIECKSLTQYRGHHFAYADIIKAQDIIEDTFILYLNGLGYSNKLATYELNKLFDQLNINGKIIYTKKTLIKHLDGIL